MNRTIPYGSHLTVARPHLAERTETLAFTFERNIGVVLKSSEQLVDYVTMLSVDVALSMAFKHSHFICERTC